MVQSVYHRLPIQKVGSLNPSRVKPMTYQIETCHYRAWCFALIGFDKDWFAQYQDNVTASGACQWFSFPVGQHYKGYHECTLSQVSIHPDMTLDVAGM